MAGKRKKAGGKAGKKAPRRRGRPCKKPEDRQRRASGGISRAVATMLVRNASTVREEKCMLRPDEVDALALNENAVVRESPLTGLFSLLSPKGQSLGFGYTRTRGTRFFATLHLLACVFKSRKKLRRLASEKRFVIPKSAAVSTLLRGKGANLLLPATICLAFLRSTLAFIKAGGVQEEAKARLRELRARCSQRRIDAGNPELQASKDRLRAYKESGGYELSALRVRSELAVVFSRLRELRSAVAGTWATPVWLRHCAAPGVPELCAAMREGIYDGERDIAVEMLDSVRDKLVHMLRHDADADDSTADSDSDGGSTAASSSSGDDASTGSDGEGEDSDIECDESTGSSSDTCGDAGSDTAGLDEVLHGTAAAAVSAVVALVMAVSIQRQYWMNLAAAVAAGGAAVIAIAAGTSPSFRLSQAEMEEAAAVALFEAAARDEEVAMSLRCTPGTNDYIESAFGACSALEDALTYHCNPDRLGALLLGARALSFMRKLGIPFPSDEELYANRSGAALRPRSVVVGEQLYTLQLTHYDNRKTKDLRKIARARGLSVDKKADKTEIAKILAAADVRWASGEPLPPLRARRRRKSNAAAPPRRPRDDDP